MDNYFRAMFIIWIVGMLLVLINTTSAQDTTDVKSILIDPLTGDTLITKDGKLIEGEILNFSGEKILITTRIEQRDTTIIIYVPVDSAATYNVEITDTILIRSNQQIEKTKIGTSEKKLSGISLPASSKYMIVNFPVYMNDSLLTDPDNYALVSAEEMWRSKDKSYDSVAVNGGGIKPIYVLSTAPDFAVLFFGDDITERQTYMFVAYNLASVNRSVKYNPLRSAFTYKELFYSTEHRLAKLRGEVW